MRAFDFVNSNDSVSVDRMMSGKFSFCYSLRIVPYVIKMSETLMTTNFVTLSSGKTSHQKKCWDRVLTSF